MLVSCCFTCVFSLLINRASLQDTVEGFIGGSVVLPCSSNKDLNQDINVRWRHNGSLIVHNIIGDRDVTENQDLLYKDRTETFHAEFEKRNFSLKLNNLTHSDAGMYQCYIIHLSDLMIIQLLINGSTAAKEKQSTEENGNPVETELLLMKILIPLGVFVLFCISLCIAFILRKRGDKTSRSGCLSNTSKPANQDQYTLQNVVK